MDRAKWVALAATASLLAACKVEPHVTVTTTEDVAITAVQRIEIFTDGGDIEVTPGEAGAVHVQADREAPTESAARALPVEITIAGNVARIVWHAAPGGNSAVSFRLRVPRELDVIAQTAGGDIRVDGDSAEGALIAETSGGNISVTHHTGAVRAHTDGGDIHVSGAVRGESVLDTEGGDIDVELSPSSQLVVTAHTAGGSTSNDFGLPGDQSGEHVSFEGTIGDGHDGSLELVTSGGSIRLRKDP